MNFLSIDTKNNRVRSYAMQHGKLVKLTDNVFNQTLDKETAEFMRQDPVVFVSQCIRSDSQEQSEPTAA
jgi:hypothetical protein